MAYVSTVPPASTTAAAVASRWRRDRVFFTAMPLTMLAAVLVGFAPTYYLKGFYGTPALSWLYHLHGFLFTTWMLLLVAQAMLVARRRTDLHRRIGRVGGVLVGLMGVAGFAVSLDLGRRGAAPPGVPPLVFLIVPLATVVVFPALVGAALYWRRNPEVHKRLMLIGTLELVPAGFGRWPVLAPFGPLGFFGVTDLFLVAIIGYDLITRGRVHAATVWGGMFLVASQVGRMVIGGTETWQALAAWMIS